jgi:hypothetical protein
MPIGNLRFPTEPATDTTRPPDPRFGSTDNAEQIARNTIRVMMDANEPRRGTADYPFQLKRWQDAMATIAQYEEQRKAWIRGGKKGLPR